jgi:hypothetical protein
LAPDQLHTSVNYGRNGFDQIDPCRRGSEANRNSDEDNDDNDPFVVVDADEAMANAERDLKADAEWKRIQQNTFTRWANEHLKQADKQVRAAFITS